MSNTFARVLLTAPMPRMPNATAIAMKAIAISHGTDGPFSTGSRIANASRTPAMMKTIPAVDRREVETAAIGFS